MTKVDPERATIAMAELWRSYNNAVSPALLEAWHQMAVILNEAGTDKTKDKWTALAMPTGTGKTLFAALYCALLPNPNPDLSNILTGNLHPGVLFVTRFRNGAEDFASLVNKQAGKVIAAAYHTHPSCDITLGPVDKRFQAHPKCLNQSLMEQIETKAAKLAAVLS